MVIAEAFLAGWEAPHGGDRVGAFWATLHAGGLTAADLASYEQPLTHPPDDSWPEDARGGVVPDLRRYLALLKAVHGGGDLAEVADRVRGRLDDRTRGAVDNVLAARAHGGGRGGVVALGDFLVAIVAARTALAAHTAEPHHDDGRVRDLLYLDLALDAAARLAVEGSPPASASADGAAPPLASHVRVLRAAAAGLALSEAGLPTAAAARDVAGTLDGVAARLATTGPTTDAGLRVAAAASAAAALLGRIVDRHTQLLGPPATAIGGACAIDPAVVATFIETFVRGGPAFALSTCLRRVAPVVRAVAATGPWTVVAPVAGTTVGPLLAVTALSSLDGTCLPPGSVLVADAVGGDEDVPDGTAHVVAAAAVDVLSHLAVRARNEGHGLVVCHDEDCYAALRAMHGGVVRAWQGGGGLHVELLDGRGGEVVDPTTEGGDVPTLLRRPPPAGLGGGDADDDGAAKDAANGSAKDAAIGTAKDAANGAAKDAANGTAVGVTNGAATANTAGEPAAPPTRPSVWVSPSAAATADAAVARAAAPWVLRPPAFSRHLVGGKSLNLTALAARLPAGVKTPPSLAIPAGALDRVLAHAPNAGVAGEITDLLRTVDEAAGGPAAGVLAAAAHLRAATGRLGCPPDLDAGLRDALVSLGCPPRAVDDTAAPAWAAVKGVWASVWADRAVLARRRVGIPHRSVAMAVLVQAVVAADYAFVAHTVHPVSGDAGVAYVELVAGLGEVLVGNAPGSALGFTYRKDAAADGAAADADAVTVVAYPSKAVRLDGGGFLFRSDSNAEDLAGFAGAGLYDSIPLAPTVETPVAYAAEPLVTDDAARTALCGRLGRLCVAVEAAMGGPQDIEGCVRGGELYVVQSRPQV